MDKQLLINIKDCLEKQLTKSSSEFSGICSLVGTQTLLLIVDGERFDDWIEYRKECFKSWSKFSGDIAYPIPGVYGMSPEDAFESRALQGGGWSSETEYGRLRRDLMRHIINCINKEGE